MTNNVNESFINFAYESPTPSHTVKNVKESLFNDGFVELFEKDKWQLNYNSKYFVTKNGTSIIAFETGSDKVSDNGFCSVFSHTDSPAFKIKPSPEIVVHNHYLKINVSAYGGPINYTWFDRPLSLAGRVYVKKDEDVEEQLVNIKRPIFTIPSLAIHLNRTANTDFNYNENEHMLPLCAFMEDEMTKDNYLVNVISNELNIETKDIIDFELLLYETQKGMVIGLDNGLISSPKIDNLVSVFASLDGLLNSKKSKKTKLLVALDNEEVGSMTAQGADSEFVTNILKRILIGLEETDHEDFYRAIAKSSGLSADLAHGVHPNYVDKEDHTNKCYLNKGIVIKNHSKGNYATTAKVSSKVIMLCEKENIPTQSYYGRSDLKLGSTMGPIVASKLCFDVCDVGISVLAMHSIRETCGSKDIKHFVDLIKAFYSYDI